MFPEIEGGTQMQPQKMVVGLHGEKSLRTPGLDDVQTFVFFSYFISNDTL